MRDDLISEACVSEVGGRCSDSEAAMSTARLVYGPHDLYVPCYDLTVEETRIAYSDVLNVSDGVESYVNGTRVAGDVTVFFGDVLEFMKPYGRKGAERGPASPTMKSAFSREVLDIAETVDEPCSLTLLENNQVGIQVSEQLSEQQIDFLRAMGPLGVIDVRMCSRLLKDGPKVVQPTAEHCDRLGGMPVHVFASEYRQPFPVFLIEVPPEYRMLYRTRVGTECPRILKVWHATDERQLYVTWHCPDEPSGLHVYNLGLRPAPDRSIEKAISRYERVNDCNRTKLVRLAINVSLLLTHVGYRDDGPLDQNAFKRQRKNSESRSPRRRKRAQRQLRRSFSLISFEQDVLFKKWDGSTEAASGESGTPKTPHWRRGHERQVRIGPGRKETKCIFVPSTFVKGEQFEGNVSDTSYRLRIEDDVVDDPQR